MVLLHRRDARDNNAGGEGLRELHRNFLEWIFTILARLKGSRRTADQLRLVQIGSDRLEALGAPPKAGERRCFASYASGLLSSPNPRLPQRSAVSRRLPKGGRDGEQARRLARVPCAGIGTRRTSGPRAEDI